MPFKKRTKADVKSKTAITLAKKNDGNKAKSGVMLVFKDGEHATLLTPSGKGTKYAQELKDGVRYTNDMRTVKADADGSVKKLTCCKRAWRSGYLAARKDSAKAYKAKKNNGSKQSSR